MTLPAQNTFQQIVAAAGQTVFPFSWQCDASASVAVWVNDVQSGGFSVALNADQVASPGGTVFALNYPGPVAGDIVTIERVGPQTQLVALTKYGPFSASIISAGLDKIVELVQENVAKLLRCVFVRRSTYSKVSSFELPVPPALPVGTAKTAIGWQTDDAGAHYHLANVEVGVTVGLTGLGILVKNEIPVGAVSSTDGFDGNGAFTIAHVPIGAQYLDLLLDGIRADPSLFVLAGAVATFTAGNHPIAGSKIRADYYY